MKHDIAWHPSLRWLCWHAPDLRSQGPMAIPGEIHHQRHGVSWPNGWLPTDEQAGTDW